MIHAAQDQTVDAIVPKEITDITKGHFKVRYIDVFTYLPTNDYQPITSVFSLWRISA